MIDKSRFFNISTFVLASLMPCISITTKHWSITTPPPAICISQQEYHRSTTHFRTQNTNKSTTSFSSIKQELAASNISIVLFSFSHFSYRVNYSRYDDYGGLADNLDMVVARGGRNENIEVAVKELANIRVKITGPSQKWAKLKTFKNPNLPLSKIAPASMLFVVVPSGTVTNPKITLNANYKLRGDKKQYSIIMGSFDVFNITTGFQHFVKQWYGILTLIIGSGLVLSALTDVTSVAVAISYSKNLVAKRNVLRGVETVERLLTDGSSRDDVLTGACIKVDKCSGASNLLENKEDPLTEIVQHDLNKLHVAEVTEVRNSDSSLGNNLNNRARVSEKRRGTNPFDGVGDDDDFSVSKRDGSRDSAILLQPPNSGVNVLTSQDDSEAISLQSGENVITKPPLSHLVNEVEDNLNLKQAEDTLRKTNEENIVLERTSQEASEHNSLLEEQLAKVTRERTSAEEQYESTKQLSESRDAAHRAELEKIRKTQKSKLLKHNKNYSAKIKRLTNVEEDAEQDFTSASKEFDRLIEVKREQLRNVEDEYEMAKQNVERKTNDYAIGLSRRANFMASIRTSNDETGWDIIPSMKEYQEAIDGSINTSEEVSSSSDMDEYQTLGADESDIFTEHRDVEASGFSVHQKHTIEAKVLKHYAVNNIPQGEPLFPTLTKYAPNIVKGFFAGELGDVSLEKMLEIEATYLAELPVLEEAAEKNVLLLEAAEESAKNQARLAKMANSSYTENVI